MSLTYHTYTYYPWEINPEELKHHYYVQLSPKRNRLVPGMLQQDTKPPTGSWLDVTAIDRDFAKRYFVQYTDFNTLVPGSLIQAGKLPKGKWKEIKKTRTQFHRVTFSDPYEVATPGGPFGIALTFTSLDDFQIDRTLPALKSVYPEKPILPYLDTWLPQPISVRYNLYFFNGTFAELNNDKTKLIPFSTSFLNLTNFSGQESPNNINTFERQHEVDLFCNSELPDGSYCFVLAIRDTLGNEIDYVVLENILVKTTL